jgi:hypothetical protein
MRNIVGCLLALFLLLCSFAQLHVIGAAFCRTGTDSFREALEILDNHTYHMTETVLKNLDDHVMLLLDNFSDERPLSEIVDDVYTKPGYSAAVDFPTVAVWKKLAAIYANARLFSRKENLQKSGGNRRLKLSLFQAFSFES